MPSFRENLKRVKYEFYDLVVKDILISLDHSLYIPAMILSFRCMESLGFHPDPDQKDRNSFKRFLSEYVSCANDLYRRPNIQNFLNSAKCNLLDPDGAGDVILEQMVIPRYETYPFESHLSISKDYGQPKEITISIFEFIADLIAGVEKYFHEITDNFKISDWYDRLFVHTGISEGLSNFRNGMYRKNLYMKLHPTLKCIDDAGSDFLKIKDQIWNSLLKQNGFARLNSK